jgi:hypothetical protein
MILMKNLLPAGSVVLLDEAEKRLMIYGILQNNPEDGKQYDYIGCLYPEGFIGSEHNYLFNHEDITRVDFVGFVDTEQQEFRVRLYNWLEEQEAKDSQA